MSVNREAAHSGFASVSAVAQTPLLSVRARSEAWSKFCCIRLLGKNRGVLVDSR
jgi:hypothetical protein